MSIFVTSDLHFNHKRILEFEPITRPFSTLEEMNMRIVNNWNSVVKSGDTVYVLGDFILGESDGNEIRNLLNKFEHGNIKLVPGNHDTVAKLKIYKDNNIEILENLYVYNYSKSRKFFLCHYPVLLSHGDKVLDYCLHGHTHQHSNFSEYKYTYHVGMDSHDLTPVCIEDIISEINSQNK